MSLTETPAAPAPKPAKKRRAIRRKKKIAAPPPSKPSGIYAGMSVGKCPDACNAEKCVISGQAICAHPGLGGLQPSMATNEALERFKAAQRYLGEQKWNLVNG